MSVVTVGILTVSDSCSQEPSKDTSGPALEAALNSRFPSYRILYKEIVPDEETIIKNTLKSWISLDCNLILTTGGTGFGPRDVTPEATKSVIDRETPGLVIGMLAKSLAVTSMAMLSRPVCGIKNKSLILNLPGSKKAALECFSFVEPALKHALDLLQDDTHSVTRLHAEIQEDKSKVSTGNLADRPRESKFPMLDVPDALDLLLNKTREIRHVGVEVIKVEDCLHRVLAQDVFSAEDLPPFDASIKDGYAVRASDGSGHRNVINSVAAGDFPDSKLESGECFRVCTGAPIPAGADAVVQVEDTRVVVKHSGEEIVVDIQKSPKLGQDIRFAGSDIKKGDLVLCAGTRLQSAHVGILASLGKSTIPVQKQSSIGLFSTGNELRQHGEKLAPGEIRDSNRLLLINTFRRYNIPVKDYGIAKDNPDAIKARFRDAFRENDVVVTTGGVSMGEFDYVKRVLVEDYAAEIHFGRVNMKPGKPTTFATLIFENREKLVFGLPGNPVSAGVTALLFVVPCLRTLEQDLEPFFPKIAHTTVSDSKNPDPRPEYERVVVSLENGVVEVSRNGNQVSSRLNSLAGANGLLLKPGNMIPDVEYKTHIILFEDLI